MLHRVTAAGLICILTTCSNGWAQPADPPPAAEAGPRRYVKPAPMSFVRVRHDDAGRPAALQVAHVVYIPTDGSRLRVTLYGAVHVGDAAYYERLNRLFEQHDALLYELANDPAALQERSRGVRSPFAMFQMDPGRMLGLADQLEVIDYERSNFVHADMPMVELIDHARAEGEDLLTVAAQTLLDVQRMVNRGEDPLAALMGPGGQAEGAAGRDPLTALWQGDGDPRQMKIQLAEQLVSQANGGILEGITVLDRYLIGARNQRCLEVLDQQVGVGRIDLGVFYGAGHHPDLHRRLMADYGLKPVDVTWNDAWDLQADVTPHAAPARAMSEEELLLELVRRLLEE